MFSLVNNVLELILEDKDERVHNLFKGMVFLLKLLFEGVLLNDNLKILFKKALFFLQMDGLDCLTCSRLFFY